jgi:serine/threonine protein kinase
MEELGAGAMATVYKARNTENGNPVAIKVPDRRLLSNVRALRQFKHEGEALIRLRHSNIVRVHAVGQQNDLPYIVMDYVDGHTLSQEIHRRGTFSGEEVISLLTPIAAALDYSHGMKTFHCDVKPGNIRLHRGRVPVLVDFGIVQTADGTVWDEGRPVGSVWYMSPEQARGERANERSDQYSLAVVAYEMLTGQVPFDGDNPYAIVLQQRDAQPPIPAYWSEPLKSVMLRALEKTPQQRFSSCLQFIAALEDAGHGRMSATSPPETIRPVGPSHSAANIHTTRYSGVPAQRVTPPQPRLSQKPGISSRQSAVKIAMALIILGSAVIVVSGAISSAKHAGNHSTPTPKIIEVKPPQSRLPVRSGSIEAKPVQPSRELGGDSALPVTVSNQLSSPSNETKAETNKMQAKAAITEGDFYYENGEYEKAIGTYLDGLQEVPGNPMLQQRLKRAQKALDTEKSILNH